jgi:sulfur carrier protein
MKVKVNGKFQELDGEQTNLTDLLIRNNVSRPEMVSVQLNGSILNQSEYKSVTVKENDEVEFLYFMGGGSRTIKYQQ